MKNLLLVSMLFATTVFMGQSFIKNYQGKVQGKDVFLNITANDGQVTGTILAQINCTSHAVSGRFKNSQTLLLNFKNSTDSAEFIYKEGKISAKDNPNAVFFIETYTQFDSELQKCKNNSFQNLIIDNVKLLSFPPTKPSGKAWDASWSNYKPDLYLSIKNGNFSQTYYKQNSMYKDIVATNLPLSFIPTQKVSINKSQFNQGLSLLIYDNDNDDDDLVGHVNVLMNPEFHTYNNTMQTLIKENGNFKIEITYHYER